MKMSHIVFDIGGTKTRVAFSNDLKTLVEVASFYTPVEPKAGIQKMIETIGEFSDMGTIATVSGGIRGVLDEERRGIVHDEVLSSWVDFDVVGELAKTYAVPIYLENDAALAGLGESHYGAGVGVDRVSYR